MSSSPNAQFTKYNLTLKTRPFTNFVHQAKDLEIRSGKDKYKQIAVGDVLLVTNVENQDDQRTLELKVVDKHHFDSLEAVLDTYDSQRFIPGHSTEEVVSIYNTYYPPELQQKLGLFVFQLELVTIHPRRLHDLRH